MPASPGSPQATAVASSSSVTDSVAPRTVVVVAGASVTVGASVVVVVDPSAPAAADLLSSSPHAAASRSTRAIAAIEVLLVEAVRPEMKSVFGMALSPSGRSSTRPGAERSNKVTLSRSWCGSHES